jgi:hypothetical protein
MFLDYCQKFAPYMKRMEFFFTKKEYHLWGESFQENDVTLLRDVVLTTMHSTHFLMDWTNFTMMTL